MNLIKNKQNSHFGLAQIGGRTRHVAEVSSSFFVYKKTIVFLLIVTLGLLVARIYFSNQLAVSGGFVSVNASRIETLEKENYKLENHLSQLSSLSYIEKKAPELGLKKISKIEVLRTDSGVALNQ